MSYLYEDEDNAAMFQEAWDAERDAAKDAEFERERQKEREALEGLLDILKVEGSCRECPHLTETAEGFLNKGRICPEQMDYLHILCVVCGGRGKGNCKPNEKYLDKDWSELTEWVYLMGMRSECIYCANVYRVYGHFKDPDDEFRAMDDLCSNCKHWGQE